MQQLRFVQIEKGNTEHHRDIARLWMPYQAEINGHVEPNQRAGGAYAAHDLERRINDQGKREDMHFEIAYLEGTAIGFAHYAIDLGGITGVIDPGYGYAMEFYIAPAYRKKGFGRALYARVEAVLRGHGARFVYTTPDPISGLAFWKAMGFGDSGKIDPDNRLPIYVKAI